MATTYMLEACHFRVAEKAKQAGMSELVACVYDEMHRNTLRDRCLRKVTSLKMDEEFRAIDKETLNMAKARLPTI